MKIRVTHKPGYFTHDFTLTGSICKTHFKQLMRVSTAYDSKTKSGTISKRNADEFLTLVDKIEKSNSAVAKKSHAKSVEKFQKRKKSCAKPKRCEHDDLGSLGFQHGSTVKCPQCGKIAEVW